jgi:hypothetical protein
MKRKAEVDVGDTLHIARLEQPSDISCTYCSRTTRPPVPLASPTHLCVPPLPAIPAARPPVVPPRRRLGAQQIDGGPGMGLASFLCSVCCPCGLLPPPRDPCDTIFRTPKESAVTSRAGQRQCLGRCANQNSGPVCYLLAGRASCWKLREAGSVRERERERKMSESCRFCFSVGA